MRSGLKEVALNHVLHKKTAHSLTHWIGRSCLGHVFHRCLKEHSPDQHQLEQRQVVRFTVRSNHTLEKKDGAKLACRGSYVFNHGSSKT